MDLFPQPPTLKERVQHVRDRLKPRSPSVHVGRIPHVDDAAQVFLTGQLASCSSYLEYGSRASTVLAAETGKPGISVENDLPFAHVVERSLPTPTNIRMCRLI